MNSNQKGPDLNGLRRAIDRRWNRSQAKQSANIQIEINNFLAKANFRNKKAISFQTFSKKVLLIGLAFLATQHGNGKLKPFLALIAIAVKHLSIVFVYTDTKKDQKLEQKTSNMIRRFKPTALGYLLGTRLQGPT